MAAVLPRPSDAAISAVMGVVLMVGILAALSGATYGMIQLLVDQQDLDGSRFPMEILKQENQNTLTVKSYTGNETLYWSDTAGPGILQVKGCTSVNDGQPLDGTVKVATADVLQCEPGEVLIIHSDADKLVFRYTFI